MSAHIPVCCGCTAAKVRSHDFKHTGHSPALFCKRCVVMARPLRNVSLDGVRERIAFEFTDDGSDLMLRVTRLEVLVEFSLVDIPIFAISCWKILYKESTGQMVYDGLIRDSSAARKLRCLAPHELVVKNAFPVLVN